ncbi:MAG: adenylyl-sulfate kinase [Burkholderiales bacterium]|jgi:bifunctional enzyme CysN/CysC|nr:adenylyl-sulfate kinase [Burkholderiales bacterium]
MNTSQITRYLKIQNDKSGLHCVICGDDALSAPLATRLLQESASILEDAFHRAADVAVIVMGAQKGLALESKRLSVLASLHGIPHVILAIEDIAPGQGAESFCNGIDKDFREFAVRLNFKSIQCLPVSAGQGGNLLATLKSVDVQPAPSAFRLPVSSVERVGDLPSSVCGTVASGTVRAGDAIRVQPSGKTSKVHRIAGADGELAQAVAGQVVTLTLQDAIDISSGDIVSTVEDPASVADQFEADFIWAAEEPLMVGRSYLINLAGQTAGVTVSSIKYKVNVNTLEHQPAKQLGLNEIAVVTFGLDRMVGFDPFTVNKTTGSFTFIDRISQQTVGAGMLHFALRRSHNIHMQAVDINKTARAVQKGQTPKIVWLTGLSGAGKSTIANLVEKKMHALGRHTYLLDGDNVRHGLNKDLGFTEADRVENIRRVAEVAKLMLDAGLIVITAFISPFRAERRMARSLVQSDEFIEVFIDTPVAVAEQRDPKGLYKKARRGELKNFTGIDSPYEAPEAPEIRLETTRMSADESAEKIVAFLVKSDIKM